MNIYTSENSKSYTIGVPLNYCKFITLSAGDVVSISEGMAMTLTTELAEDINKTKPDNKKAIKVITFVWRGMPDSTTPLEQLRASRLWSHKGTSRGFIPIVATTVDGDTISDSRGEGVQMLESHWTIKGEGTDIVAWKPCIKGLYRSWLKDTIEAEQEVLNSQQAKVQELQKKIIEFAEL